MTRVKAHIPESLAQKNVSLLTVRDLREWRDNLAKRLAPASVNRTAAAFKAALNLAADNDERIATRQAWDLGLATIPDAEESRNVILDESVVLALVANARDVGAEFGLLVELAAVTGARVSQLARLEVQDVQPDRPDPRLMMPSSRKGRGQKKIQRRPAPTRQRSRSTLCGTPILCVKSWPECQYASSLSITTPASRCWSAHTVDTSETTPTRWRVARCSTRRRRRRTTSDVA
jgi:hypothetical protein